MKREWESGTENESMTGRGKVNCKGMTVIDLFKAFSDEQAARVRFEGMMPKDGNHYGHYESMEPFRSRTRN